MKTATVQDLKTHFPKVEAWLNEGEEIEITKHGKLIAWVMPASRLKKFKLPDFMARLKKRCGNRVLTAEESAAILQESRGEC